jgi:hypothetical protein
MASIILIVGSLLGVLLPAVGGQVHRAVSLPASTAPGGTVLLGGFDVGRTAGIAVYPYSVEAASLYKRKEEIHATITDERSIRNIIDAFDYRPRDGRAMGTVPSGYVYLKDSRGHVVKLLAVGHWRFLLVGDDWRRLYPLSRKGAKALIDNIREAPVGETRLSQTRKRAP